MSEDIIDNREEKIEENQQPEKKEIVIIKHYNKPPGNQTMLDNELKYKIRKYILKGKGIRETAEAIINDNDEFINLEEKEKEKKITNLTQNIYNWKYDNKLNLGTDIENWKLQYKIKLAEDNLEKYLKMNDLEDDKRIRIKTDLTKFTLETLAKDKYSKRTEVTGKDGKDINPYSELSDEELEERIKKQLDKK